MSLKLNIEGVCAIQEIPQLFTNAVVIDGFGQLRFASFIGRSATIQHLLANITVGEITSLTIYGKKVSVNKYFEKTITKIPGDSCPFGELEQVFFVHDELSNTHANKHAIVGLTSIDEQTIWSALKAISELPLLDKWQKSLMPHFYKLEMIQPLNTLIGPVQAVLINVSDKKAFAKLISMSLRNATLSV